MDLILRRARLGDASSLQDLGIEHGRIVAVTPELAGPAASEVDVQGRLVLPAFVNPHFHADKVFFSEWTAEDQGGTVEDGFRKTIPFKTAYTVDDVQRRAMRVLRTGMANGTLAARLMADVDTFVGLTAVRGLLAARSALKPLMTLQVVAFPQEGIFTNPGTEALLHEALALGADVVGGLPWVEVTEEDQRRHVDLVFSMAMQRDLDIHMLVDDTLDPGSRTLEYLAVKTIREGYQGRVAASHCCALSVYDAYHAARVVHLVADAGITIVSNAHISLVDQGQRLAEPRPRGITRVRDLLEAGVNVASAQDDVDDPYYPFGKPDQLEVAWMMAHAAQLTDHAGMHTVVNMVTNNAARAMRLEGYGLTSGSWADLVVLEARSIPEALRLQPERAYVIRQGRVVAQTERRTVWLTESEDASVSR
jgi:cytosine deaminase